MSFKGKSGDKNLEIKSPSQIDIDMFYGEIKSILDKEYRSRGINISIDSGKIAVNKFNGNLNIYLIPSNKEGYCRIGGLDGEYKYNDAIKIAELFGLLHLEKDRNNQISYVDGEIVAKIIDYFDYSYLNNRVVIGKKEVGYLFSLGIDIINFSSYISLFDSFQEKENKIKKELEELAYEIMLNKLTKIEVQNEFYVEFKYEKSSLSLDPSVHFQNAISATRELIRVSREQYNDFKGKIGKDISRKFDGIKMLTDGEFSSYYVSVSGVKVKSQFIGFDNDGNQYNISNLDDVLSRLKSKGKQINYVEDGDNDLHYVGGFENIDKPRKKYSLKLRIENTSLSLDLFKHLRNSLTAHEITIEVPKKIYDNLKVGQIYDETDINIASLFMKGRVGNIEVRVLEKNEKD